MAKNEEKDKDLDQEEEEEGTEPENESEDENESEGDEPEEGEESDEEEEGDEPGKKKKDEDIDYEAELELETERAAQGAFKERQDKRNGKQGTPPAAKEDDDEEADDDKPVTGRQIKEILRQQGEYQRKEILADSIRDKVGRMTKNQNEANLIVAIHKNRTWPKGISLDQQLEEAYAIANRGRITKQMSELKRALKSKDTASRGGASAHRDAPRGNEPQAGRNGTALKARGFKWDDKQKAYTKQVAGGKRTLFYDPRQDKYWSEKK